jgi:hypothetical protein
MGMPLTVGEGVAGTLVAGRLDAAADGDADLVGVAGVAEAVGDRTSSVGVGRGDGCRTGATGPCVAGTDVAAGSGRTAR